MDQKGSLVAEADLPPNTHNHNHNLLRPPFEWPQKARGTGVFILGRQRGTGEAGQVAEIRTISKNTCRGRTRANVKERNESQNTAESMKQQKAFLGINPKTGRINNPNRMQTVVERYSKVNNPFHPSYQVLARHCNKYWWLQL